MGARAVAIAGQRARSLAGAGATRGRDPAARGTAGGLLLPPWRAQPPRRRAAHPRPYSRRRLPCGRHRCVVAASRSGDPAILKTPSLDPKEPLGVAARSRLAAAVDDDGLAVLRGRAPHELEPRVVGRNAHDVAVDLDGVEALLRERALQQDLPALLSGEYRAARNDLAILPRDA